MLHYYGKLKKNLQAKKAVRYNRDLVRYNREKGCTEY
jgi:hypothetical protein